jgi:hypothetical protein
VSYNERKRLVMKKQFFAVLVLFFALPVAFAQKLTDQCNMSKLEVFFDPFYTGIQGDSMPKVKDLAVWMKFHPQCKVKVSANVCISGNPDTDYGRMIGRAEDLEITLTRFGVSVHQSVEYGEKESAPFGTEREQRCRSAFATVVDVANIDFVKTKRK